MVICTVALFFSLHKHVPVASYQLYAVSLDISVRRCALYHHEVEPKTDHAVAGMYMADNASTMRQQNLVTDLIVNQALNYSETKTRLYGMRSRD